MKVAGSHALYAAAEQVWPLISDPASLISLIPGCDKLEPVGLNAYRKFVRAFVALSSVAGRAILGTCI